MKFEAEKDGSRKFIGLNFKLLSNEMYLAEFKCLRSAFIKERGAEVIRKIRPSPVLWLWEPFKDSAQSRTSVGNKVAKSAYSSVSALSLHTTVGKGAVNVFRICFQWRNEHFKPIMLLFSVINGAMNARRYWQWCDVPEDFTDCGMRSVWLYHVFPIPMARWISWPRWELGS